MTLWQFIGVLMLVIPAIWQALKIEKRIPPLYVLGLLLAGGGLLAFGG